MTGADPEGAKSKTDCGSILTPAWPRRVGSLACDLQARRPTHDRSPELYRCQRTFSAGHGGDQDADDTREAAAAPPLFGQVLDALERPSQAVVGSISTREITLSACPNRTRLIKRSNASGVSAQKFVTLFTVMRRETLRSQVRCRFSVRSNSAPAELGARAGLSSRYLDALFQME
jgi:hypothetical protein